MTKHDPGNSDQSSFLFLFDSKKTKAQQPANDNGEEVRKSDGSEPLTEEEMKKGRKWLIDHLDRYGV